MTIYGGLHPSLYDKLFLLAGMVMKIKVVHSKFQILPFSSLALEVSMKNESNDMLETILAYVIRIKNNCRAKLDCFNMQSFLSGGSNLWLLLTVRISSLFEDSMNVSWHCEATIEKRTEFLFSFREDVLSFLMEKL